MRKYNNISFHLITNDGNDSSHYGRGRVLYSRINILLVGLETGYYI